MKMLLFLLIICSQQSHASIDFEGFQVKDEVKWKALNLKDTTTLRTALESPSKKSTFTVREFFDIKEKTLKQNVKSWLKDYRSYGFTISNQKPVKLNDKTYGYLIEAIHKHSGKIFKQYMSINGDRLVTLTCHSNRVDKEFKTCGESLMSFSWNK